MKEVILLDLKCHIKAGLQESEKEDIRRNCHHVFLDDTYQGKPYCVFHSPNLDKIDDFNRALKERIEQGNFDFRFFYFPSDISFSRGDLPLLFMNATFVGKVTFFGIFEQELDFRGAFFDRNSKLHFNTTGLRQGLDLRRATFLGSILFEGGEYMNAEDGELVDYLQLVFEGEDAWLDLQETIFEKPEHVHFHTVRLEPNWFVGTDPRKFNFTDCRWMYSNESDINTETEIDKVYMKNGFLFPSNPNALVAKICQQLAVNYESNNDWETAAFFLEIADKAKSEKNAENNKIFTDRELMVRTIELAKKCTSEEGKNSPKVAALVVRDGIILGEAYRGEIEPGEHAEFTVLEKKLHSEILTGATLFTTLEPCTSRNHPKVPCANRIIERGISKVVIGILDRNPIIQVNGWWKLQDAGVQITHFDSDLAKQIEETNRDFLRPYRHRTEGELKEPVEQGQTGINGFPIGYDEYGNKVEWVEEDGEKWAMILRRNDRQIAEELAEFTDKVWYIRKKIMFEKMERGEEELKPEHEPFVEKALIKMKEMEDKYGKENLLYDDFDWGFLQGKMSALRWVFGDDWETSLDI